jgi:hypothetical protein
MDDAFAAAAYTDTGLTPGTAYYYRVQAHNEHGWGELSGPLKAETPPLSAPSGFRVSTTDASSIGLAWNAVSGATAYKIYHVQSSSAPADNAYTPLSGADNLGPAVTTYTHSSLSNGDTHYYKISAVFGSHGEGPKSGEVHATTGAPPSYATVDMSTGVLDADFGDSSKAASNTSSLTPTQGTVNWDIKSLYVANDATNLYIALDFGSVPPAGYKNDRIVVMIDNTNSNTGGADYTTVPIAESSDVTGSLEGYISLLVDTGTLVGPTGVACNVNSWTPASSDTSWLSYPNPSINVIKFSVPLTSIGAVKDHVIKICAAFSGNWDVLGDLIPKEAGGSVSADNKTVTIITANALAFTIK